MGRPWVDCKTYASIMEQAAKNDGRAVLEARGYGPFEIKIDVEYAKKEWAEIEEMLKRIKEKNYA